MRHWRISHVMHEVLCDENNVYLLQCSKSKEVQSGSILKNSCNRKECALSPAKKRKKQGDTD
ncbi:hypothetical protein DPMN_049761 [Dreissena polymorpha]|uniref:Uncharacterized protein n=1 Tax=Dreissena polymorpha TaxID=45954 RepID=A0A9D4CEX1_DREPO|nr:hypothetical protein DPMN_049761 [Dreissena polymorpha]